MASGTVVRNGITLFLVVVVLVISLETTEGLNPLCGISKSCSNNFRESQCDYNIHAIGEIAATEKKLTLCLIRNRKQETRSISKWRTHITKTAIALFLSDSQFFSPDNKTGQELAYELSLELLSELALKKKIPTTELSLFINALSVACIDPKDFYGINMVEELRQQVNNGNRTNPFAILTLCNAKDTMTTDDIFKLQNQYDTQSRPLRTDTQAMIVTALSCIYSKTKFKFPLDDLEEMISELKKRQQENGSVGNLKTTALVVQALLAAGDCSTDFDLSSALNFILQQVKENSNPDIQDIYYILPILRWKSFAHIDSNHCIYPAKTDRDVISNLREHPEERIHVQISVFVGNDKHTSRTWKVKVPRHYSLYQVLENIGTLEPAYKVQYSLSDGKPYVDGLAGFQDDTVEGSFWFIYTKPLSSTEGLKRIEKSPVDIQMNEFEEMILWYRSGFWANTLDESQVNTNKASDEDVS